MCGSDRGALTADGAPAPMSERCDTHSSMYAESQYVISDNREMKSNTGETRPTHDRSDMCWYRHDITQVWQRDLLTGSQPLVLYEAMCLQVCSALHCSLHFCLYFNCFHNCSASPLFQLLCLFAFVFTQMRRANCSTGHRKRRSHRHTAGHGNTHTHTHAGA